MLLWIALSFSIEAMSWFSFSSSRSYKTFGSNKNPEGEVRGDVGHFTEGSMA